MLTIYVADRISLHLLSLEIILIFVRYFMMYFRYAFFFGKIFKTWKKCHLTFFSFTVLNIFHLTCLSFTNSAVDSMNHYIRKYWGTRNYRKSVLEFCVSVLGRLRDLQYIFAVTSGSPSISRWSSSLCGELYSTRRYRISLLVFS